MRRYDEFREAVLGSNIKKHKIMHALELFHDPCNACDALARSVVRRKR